MSRFEGLPEELKLKILEYFFADAEDLNVPSVRHVEVNQTATEYTVMIPSSHLNCPALPEVTRSQSKPLHHLTVTVRPHRTFAALFVSKSFICSALPVFVRSTSLQISCIKQYFTPLSKSFRRNFVDETILALLSQARTLEIPTDQRRFATKNMPFLTATLPSLQTLIFQDFEILLWSRFESSNDIGTSTPTGVRDVFQTPQIAAICHPITQMVLSEAEFRDLRSREMIFPGDLGVLCQYIRAVAGGNCPKEIHRIVAIGCYADMSSSEEEPSWVCTDATKQKILIYLKIDVRALNVLAVDIHLGEWAEG